VFSKAENWNLVLKHPVSWRDRITAPSLKTRVISCEKFSHSESDTTMIEISYSIPPSACHSVSFRIELSIRSRIQAERNQTRDTKQLTASKILMCVCCHFTSHTPLFCSINKSYVSARNHEWKYIGTLISLWLFLFAAQPKESFLDGLKKLEERSHKCVELRGEYVE
jgi:hypothetical protein